MIESFRYIVGLGMPQGWDWVWIFLVALLLFGGKRLPEIARSIGRSLNEFKKGVKDIEDDTKDVVDDVKKTKDEFVNQTKDSAGPKENNS